MVRCGRARVCAVAAVSSCDHQPIPSPAATLCVVAAAAAHGSPPSRGPRPAAAAGGDSDQQLPTARCFFLGRIAARRIWHIRRTTCACYGSHKEVWTVRAAGPPLGVDVGLMPIRDTICVGESNNSANNTWHVSV